MGSSINSKPRIQRAVDAKGEITASSMSLYIMIDILCGVQVLEMWHERRTYVVTLL